MIGQYKIIALCTNRIHDKECYEFVGELNRCLCETDMRLFVLNTDITDEEGHFRSSGSSDIHELLAVKGIDVVIVDEERLKSPVVTQRLIDTAKALLLPVVVLGEPHDGCLNIKEEESGFEDIVKHLIDTHGYTRFHMIAGKENDPFSNKRIAMFKDTLAVRGLTFDDSMISYGDFWSEPAVAATEKLIAEGRLPEAIVCANDNMALAVIDALKRHGYRVPEDIAVTGYDGIEEIYYSEPMLTTVTHSDKKFCKALSSLLSQALAGRTDSKLVSAELLLNRSCGCECTAKTEPSHYITAQNNRFNRYQDENIVLAEVSAKIQMCDSFDEMCYLMHEDDKMYAMCCLLKKECIDNTIDPRTVVEKGFGDELFLLFDSDMIQYMQLNGERFSPHMTPSSEIVPVLDYYLGDKRCIIFNSLCYLGVSLGYVVFHYNDHIEANYLKIPQTVTALNNAIGGFRNNRYQQYLMQRIDEMYRTDSLTGLLNRHGFAASYEQLLDSLGERQMSVVLCDLDGLKYINDNFGHKEGDVAIHTAAQALKNICPENAVCTRFGGDEMLAVFPYEDIDIRERFNAELANFNGSSGKPYKVAGSIGIIRTESGERPTLEELIKRTDSPMYEEKRRRKAQRI